MVDAGTALSARVPGVAVAGKTGTAQNPHGKDHALFVCYAPADSPVVAMAFVVENAGHGGSVCAPIAGAVLKAWLAHDTTAVVPPRPRIAPRDTTSRDTTEATIGD